MRVTVGGFDGIHIAHQELIKKSDKVVIIEKGSSLTPGFDRLEYINKPFDFLLLEMIKTKTPKEFIEYLKKLNATIIIVGEDFRFGANRSGDIDLLSRYFEVEIIMEIKIDGIGVHSKVIREFIKKGDIKKANKFLGKNYKIKGTQIKGQGIGSKELVPTINIELFKPYTLPKPGVYLTKTNNHPSLTFLGVRSTDNNYSIETHILNFDNFDFKFIEVEFVGYLRDNHRFNSLDELKSQIHQDIKTASTLFQEQL